MPDTFPRDRTGCLCEQEAPQHSSMRCGFTTRSGPGWYCTRSIGHDGDHVALNYYRPNVVNGRWAQGDSREDTPYGQSPPEGRF